MGWRSFIAIVELSLPTATATTMVTNFCFQVSKNVIVMLLLVTTCIITDKHMALTTISLLIRIFNFTKSLIPNLTAHRSRPNVIQRLLAAVLLNEAGICPDNAVSVINEYGSLMK